MACLQWLLFCELASAVLKDLPDNPRLTYTRDYLMQLGLQPHHIVFTDSSNQYNSTCSRTKVNGRGNKKGGVRARLKRETCKQRALPSIIMANVRSLHNKTDELQASFYHMHEYRTASILAFTET